MWSFLYCVLGGTSFMDLVRMLHDTVVKFVDMCNALRKAPCLSQIAPVLNLNQQQ